MPKNRWNANKVAVWQKMGAMKLFHLRHAVWPQHDHSHHPVHWPPGHHTLATCCWETDVCVTTWALTPGSSDQKYLNKSKKYLEQPRSEIFHICRYFSGPGPVSQLLTLPPMFVTMCPGIRWAQVGSGTRQRPDTKHNFIAPIFCHSATLLAYRLSLGISSIKNQIVGIFLITTIITISNYRA